VTTTHEKDSKADLNSNYEGINLPSEMCLESEREGPIGDVDSNISDSDIRMK
jgi:hypothetical protein